MKRAAKLVMRDTERVRRHVMGIIYHSEGRRVKLPSLRELADRFGLAVSTVKIAFDRMEADGYLSSRHGVGNFTNPSSFFFPGGRVMPLIGVKVGRGDSYYYNGGGMKQLSELTGQLAEYPCNLHFLGVGCATPEEFAEELDQSCIDAFVSLSVLPELVAVAAARYPSVNIGYPSDTASSVVFNGRDAALKLSADLRRSFPEPRVLLLDEVAGRREEGENRPRHVYGFTDTLLDDPRLRCFRREDGGVSVAEDMEKALVSGRFDCVLTLSRSAEFVREMLDRGGRPDARIVLMDDAVYPRFPDCDYLWTSRAEQTSTILGWLFDMLAGKPRAVMERVMDVQLRRHHRADATAPPVIADAVHLERV